MKRNGLLALVASVVVLCALGTPVLAHHSFAAVFDANQPITVKGVITQVRLENPHSWFFLDVKDATGKVEKWAFEAGTPSGMIRNGFRSTTIKAGTEVTIKGIRARDMSQKMGMLRELVMADGTVYGLFGSQEAK
jgi:DNA/RNA endonuclease YhcR with UshA esterase domain